MQGKLEKQIIKFIREYELLTEGDRVLLGLSGGPDSVFAFHFLLKFKETLGIEFSALHLNHNLRGNESDNDEKFCIELCKTFNIQLFSHSANIRTVKKSVEEAAREVRYNFFNKCAEEQNFQKIVTAHNLDDNTETVFLNLIKGCGISALAGIPLSRGKIIRPFLCVSKQEINDYLLANGIESRLDSSNLNPKYERNYLRYEIVPKLKENINPNLNQSVFNTSGIVRKFYSLFELEAEKLFNEYIEREHGSTKIKSTLFNQDEFLVGEVLKKVFKNILGIEFNQKSFRILIELNNNHVGKRNLLRSGWVAVKERDYLEINSKTEVSKDEIRFEVGENYTGEDIIIETEIMDWKGIKPESSKNLEFISADNLDDIFILRRWNSGDRFKPLGLKGQKKVSDFLTDIKISNKSRNKVYVLLNRNQIVWVAGLRIDDNFKITESTKKICRLHLK